MESAVEAQQGVETAVNETESQQITQAQIATLAQVTGNNSQQQKVNIGEKKKKLFGGCYKTSLKRQASVCVARHHGESLVALGDPGNRSRLSHGSHSNASAAPQRADGAGPRRHPGRTAVCYSVATGPDRAGRDTQTHSHTCCSCKAGKETKTDRQAEPIHNCFLFQISTIAESEDSQESVDSVTDSQKRREILSRRPSYR